MTTTQIHYQPFRPQPDQVLLPDIPPLEQQEAPQEISGKQKPKQAKGIEIQPRDEQLLELLYYGRYLTMNQLLTLLWRKPDGSLPTSPRAAQHRLHLLTQAGLIRAIQQQVQRGKGELPYIYTLDRAGAILVSERLGIDYASIDWKPKALESNYLFLSHLLETHNLRIAMTLSAQKLGITLSTWLYENALRSKEWVDHVLLRDNKGREARVSVIPDSFCALETPHGIGYLTIEIDRGTVTLAKWQHKIQAYLAYHASGEYEKCYQAKNFRLLTVTTSLPRLLNLKKQCEKVAAKDNHFWFTTFDQVVTKVPISSPRPGHAKPRLRFNYVYNDELLMAPLWYRANSDQLHSLLE